MSPNFCHSHECEEAEFQIWLDSGADKQTRQYPANNPSSRVTVNQQQQHLKAQQQHQQIVQNQEQSQTSKPLTRNNTRIPSPVPGRRSPLHKPTAQRPNMGIGNNSGGGGGGVSGSTNNTVNSRGVTPSEFCFIILVPFHC